MDNRKAAIIAGVGCLLAGGALVALLVLGVGFYAFMGPSSPLGSVGRASRPVYSSSRISGVFYMQKMWIATRHLESAVWYFGPDGRVSVNPSAGLAAADLAALKPGERGRFTISGGKMTVTWDSGQKSAAPLEIVDGGFNWDTGMYIPVEPFASRADLNGHFEGGSSMSFGGGSSMLARTLELRPDGTYGAEGAASVASDGARVGGQSATRGKWTLDGWILTLTTEDGTVTRGMAFPLDDEKTPVKPDRMFFAGMNYKKTGAATP